MNKCIECGTEVRIPRDSDAGEIIDCPCCGTGYQVVKKKGKLCLAVSEIEGEDWGE